MNCPFCAEEIQDAAIICRLCGATREGDEWTRDVRPPRGPSIALRFSAVLFMIGAFFELVSLRSPVPLFGAVREGAVAMAYHVLFGAVFLVIGIALWREAHWMLRALLVGGILYTIDKGAYLLDQGSRQDEVLASLGEHPQLVKMVDVGSIDLLQQLVAALTLLGFWLFVLYAWWRHARTA